MGGRGSGREGRIKTVLANNLLTFNLDTQNLPFFLMGWNSCVLLGLTIRFTMPESSNV